jgi:hypothetical protein
MLRENILRERAMRGSMSLNTRPNHAEHAGRLNDDDEASALVIAVTTPQPEPPATDDDP